MLPQRALLPDFEEDIFINYAHNDNKARLANFKGWVDTMHEGLGARLTELIGEEPKIWRDIVLKGNQQLTDTIVFRLSKTAFLVSVLSPSYVKSEWCQKELNEFYARAAQNGKIKINNRSRIFKVVKTPIGDNDPRNDPLKECNLPLELRTLLQESLGYNFFEFDDKGRLCEYWPELGPDYQKKFLARLEDLARDIKEFIQYQQAQSNGADSKKNNIYLAETTPELCEDRNEIKRTLQQHNYRVLPDENLPFDPSAFEEKVRGYIQQCALSIHLIGSDHASTTADPEVLRRLNPQHQLAAERVNKQHELAMNRSDDPQFSRLIWMPLGLTAEQSDYQQFIAYLQNDPAVYENAEVLCGSKLEDLKTILQKKLKFSRRENNLPGTVKRVYLICDRQDMGAAAPLRDFLRQQNYEVLLPFKENGQVVTGHKENLRLCDAVLVYYGSANTMEWKLKDLKRIAVFRDDKPLLSKAIYVAGPETDEKRQFSTDEALVIKNFGEFSEEMIKPFLEEVKQSSPAISTGGGTL